jgi:Uma2 family endonuclease
MAFDSSTGFRLPDNSVLSPDASLVALARWQALSANERRGFAPLCLIALRRKMAAYQRNGARLGWLLIPEEQAVEVWSPQQAGAEAPQRIAPASSISADPLFPGLVINLDELWAS